MVSSKTATIKEFVDEIRNYKSVAFLNKDAQEVVDYINKHEAGLKVSTETKGLKTKITRIN